jgi:hypothetical protein
MEARISDIKSSLASIEADVQGINRYRYQYQLRCLEEFVEALSFAHYLQTQTLITPEEASRGIPGNVLLTPHDYMYGVFDIFGEMMRFATVTTAHSGAMAGAEPRPEAGSAVAASTDANADAVGGKRTILEDIQELRSCFEMLPEVPDKVFPGKIEAMRNSVRKVERLAYGLVIRGTERPKGWVPDMNEVEMDTGER